MRNELCYILAVVAFLSISCDDSVNAVRTDGKAFTMYGLINPRADTQAIRVFPIDEILEAEQRDRVDGDMMSTNLSSGASQSWSDSLVTFADNNLGHVYFSNFVADYDTPYQITITRSDGATSTALTKTPPQVSDVIEVTKDTGTDIDTKFSWSPAPRLQNVQARYNLLVELLGELIDTFFIIDYVPNETIEASDWDILLKFDDDAREIFRSLNRPTGSRLTLCDVDVEALVSNREWFPPDGNYNPDVLVQPGVFSNVENGFGFIGAGYTHVANWVPDSTQIRGAGFQYDPRCYNRN